MTATRQITTFQLMQEMCRDLRADGLSTQGMYTAYLLGENRRMRKLLEDNGLYQPAMVELPVE